jgi:hypothetical protein
MDQIFNGQVESEMINERGRIFREKQGKFKIRKNYTKFSVEGLSICELTSARLMAIVQNSEKLRQVFADTVKWSDGMNEQPNIERFTSRRKGRCHR